jgi:hypothetical protein
MGDGVHPGKPIDSPAGAREGGTAVQPRAFLIVVGAVVVAFAVAFSIAHAAGRESSDAAAGAAPADVIGVGGATVSHGLTAAEVLPALQVSEKRKPNEPASSGGDPTPPAATNTPAPSTGTPPAPTTPTPAPTPTSTGGDSPIETGGG